MTNTMARINTKGSMTELLRGSLSGAEVKGRTSWAAPSGCSKGQSMRLHINGKTVTASLDKRYADTRIGHAVIKLDGDVVVEPSFAALHDYAIVEATETGSSLRANNLRIVDTVLVSTTRFIANKKCLKNQAKKHKVDQIVLLLQGAINAQDKVGLKMNVAKGNLKKILKVLPALKKPTVSSLSNDGWYDVETVIDEAVVRDLIPDLRKAGAEGIIEYPLNKVIY